MRELLSDNYPGVCFSARHGGATIRPRVGGAWTPVVSKRPAFSNQNRGEQKETMNQLSEAAALILIYSATQLASVN